MCKKIDTTISFYKFINITNLDAVKSKIYRSHFSITSEYL